MKTLINPIINGNYIYFDGTDEIGDLSISLRCWPKNGVHSGIYNWVKNNIDWIERKLDTSGIIEVRGYSMGGPLAIETGRWLAKRGHTVNCKVKAPFKTYCKKITIPEKLKVIIYENGNDPITSLFPWLKHMVKPIHIGDKRVWYKVILNFFLFLGGKGDHVSYD